MNIHAKLHPRMNNTRNYLNKLSRLYLEQRRYLSGAQVYDPI